MASSPELKIKIAVDGASTAASEIGKVSGQLGALGNTSSKAGDIGRSWRGLAADFAHVGQSVLLAKSAVDMAVNAVSGMVTGYVQAAVASQKLASSLEFSAGSARGAAQEIEYLRRVSRDMGLDFGTASGAYAKFAASARSAGMSLGDTHKIFEGISKAGARFGLSSEEMSGAFLALGQMASKGVVSMEELRGQLGERLPGAFDLAAKAMGVTQVELIKLVESGKLAASDFLPKFGQALNDNITVPMGTLQQSINNASTSWELWKRALAEGAGGGSLGWLTNGLNESAAAMRLLGNEAGIVHKLFVAIGAFQAGAVTKGMGFDIALAQEKGRDRARELREYIAPLQAQLDKIGYLTPMQHEALRTAKRDLDDINTELAKLALRSGREAGIKLPNLKEQVEKQRSSEDARLKAYSDDTQFAPKAAKIAADIEKENKAFNAAVVGLQETDARYIAALKTHNERVAAIKAKGAEEATGDNERQRLVTSLKGQIAAFEAQGEALAKLTATETSYAKFRATSKLASDADINALYQRAIALEKSGAATAAAKKEEEDYQKLKEQNLRALAGELKSIEDQVDAQKKHNEEIGLTTEALAQLEQHRLDDAIATQEQAFAQEQKEGADLVELKLIDDKIAALRDLKSLKAEGAARQVVADEAKRAADDWKKFTDDIERSLTDSLMRSFESGENFGKTFVKSLQNTLKTTVLKVAVQAVVGDVMGAVGLGSGGSGSGSSIGSMLSMGSNLSSLAGGGSSMYGAFATSGMGQALGLSQMSGGMSVAATEFAGMTVPAAEIAGTAELTSLGATLGSVAAAAPYALAALAIADAVGAFGKRGGPQQGQYSQTTRDSFNVSHTSSGGAPLDSKALAAAVLGQVDMLYSMAGRQKANVMIDQGYGFDPQGTSQDMKYRKINIDGRQLTSFDDRSSRGDSAGAAAMLSHLTSREIEAIASAIDDSKLNGIIATLKANFGDLATAMEKYAVGQAKQQALLSLLQSDEDKQRDTANSLFAAVGGAFNSLNVTMPDSVAGLHAFVAGLDLTTKSGADTLATLDSLGPTLVSYIEAAKKVEADRRSWQEKLDVLNGTTTEKELERSRTLASTSDAATQALMRQVWAMEDQKLAAEEAAAAIQKAADLTRAGFDAYGSLLSVDGRSSEAAAVALKKAKLDKDAATEALAKQLGITPDDIQNYIASIGGFTDAASTYWNELGNATDAETLKRKELLVNLANAHAAVMKAQGEIDSATRGNAAAALDAARKATDSWYASLERAISKQKESIKITIDAAQEQVNATKALANVLKSAISDLRGEAAGAVMSGASAQQFIADAVLAAQTTGYLPDSDELSKAISAARSGIDATAYASSVDAVLARVRLADNLTSLGDVTGSKLTIAEQQLQASKDQLKTLDDQLQAAKDQIDVLRGIDISIASVATAMSGLAAAIAAERNAASVVTPPSTPSTPPSTPSTPPSTPSTSPSTGTGQGNVSALQINAEALKRHIDASFAANIPENQMWLGVYNEAKRLGYTSQGLAEVFQYAGWANVTQSTILDWARSQGLPAFAAGGFHAGGIRLVGENGPELEVTGPSRIYNAAQTRNLMSGSGEMVAEIRALRAENEQLRQEMAMRLAKIEGNTGRTAKAVNGNPDAPILVETV